MVNKIIRYLPHLASKPLSISSLLPLSYLLKIYRDARPKIHEFSCLISFTVNVLAREEVFKAVVLLGKFDLKFNDVTNQAQICSGFAVWVCFKPNN